MLLGESDSDAFGAFFLRERNDYSEQAMSSRAWCLARDEPSAISRTVSIRFRSDVMANIRTEGIFEFNSHVGSQSVHFFTRVRSRRELCHRP